MAASELSYKLSPDDMEQLKRYIYNEEVETMKAFLSAKNVGLSDSVLWPEDERSAPLIVTAMMFGKVESTLFLLKYYPQSLSINHKFIVVDNLCEDDRNPYLWQSAVCCI